jgi:hypothetical protein
MANPYFTANRVKLVQLVAEKRLPQSISITYSLMSEA